MTKLLDQLSAEGSAHAQSQNGTLPLVMLWCKHRKHGTLVLRGFEPRRHSLFQSANEDVQ